MINTTLQLRKQFSFLSRMAKMMPTRPEPKKEFNKKAFLAELEQERQRYDQEYEERRATYQFLDKEQIREYNITLGKYDYQKIYLQNVGLFPKQRFDTVAEIYYFLRNANTDLTVENILLCMRGLVHFGQQDGPEEKDHHGNFDYFLDVLERGIILIHDVDALKEVALFGDLFCVESEPFWNNLQNQLMRRLHDQPNEVLMQVLVHFSNQQEGGEDFYTYMEGNLQKRSLSAQHTAQAICCFYRLRYGTKEFVQSLFQHFFQNLDQLDKNTLLQTLICYQQVQEVDLSHFLAAEKTIQDKHMQSLTFYEICEISMAFGKENGSAQFVSELQLLVVSALERGTVQVNPESLMMVVQGFVFNLRATEPLLQCLHPHILNNLQQLSIGDLARIIKSTHLLEYDDLAFNQAIEGQVLRCLKEVDEVSLDDFLEVVKSYTVTRIGSRQLYKTMDLWIQFRWEEISEDKAALETLSAYLGQSGLVSIRTLKMIQNMI